MKIRSKKKQGCNKFLILQQAQYSLRKFTKNAKQKKLATASVSKNILSAY